MPVWVPKSVGLHSVGRKARPNGVAGVSPPCLPKRRTCAMIVSGINALVEHKPDTAYDMRPGGRGVATLRSTPCLRTGQAASAVCRAAANGAVVVEAP